jgi:hypothetical protein
MRHQTMNDNVRSDSQLHPQAVTPAWSLRWLSVILAAAPLLALFFWLARWEIVLALVLVALLWGLSPIRWEWPGSFALALLVCAAAAGLWLGAPLWALVGLIAALSGWDLERFTRQLLSAGQVQQRQQHIRRHVLRLAALDTLSLALGWAAMNARVDLNFGAALVLSVLAILGLAYGIRHLMRATTEK